MATPANTLGSARSLLPKRFRKGLERLDSSASAGVRSSEEGPEQKAQDLRQAADATSADHGSNSIVEVDFTQLKDGSLVELVQDSSNANRTVFAVCKDGVVQFVDRLERDGQVLVPLARNSEILRHIRLARDAKPYGSVLELLSQLEAFISRCVAVDEEYVAVLADFVLSTWFVDRFSVAPYLSAVGLPQSGKTTLLRVLSLVCRRSLLISDITSANFYRACAQFTPTILIDETATVTNNRTLRHILRSGTTRDIVAVRRNHTYHSYGAKVISWLEPLMILH